MRTRLSATPLELRDCPATLDLVGGVLVYAGDAGANVVTVQIIGQNYYLTDSSPFVLSNRAKAAGWAGGGTTTVRGPLSSVGSVSLDLGSGDDTLNIRALNAGDPANVSTGNGTDAVNVCSNAGVNTGTLDTILAAVAVFATGADGAADSLWLSDLSSSAGNSAVVLSPGVVSGLLPGSDLTYYGIFSQLRVTGSSLLGDNVLVSGTSCPVLLETGGGDDSVAVSGSSDPVAVSAGGGDDSVAVSTLAVESGISVSLGGGANSLVLDDSDSAAPISVVVNASSVSGMNPGGVSYSCSGGTVALSLLLGAGADSVAVSGTHPPTTLSVDGGAGDDTFFVAGDTSGALSGGAGDDTFSVARFATFVGNWDGGAGDDAFFYNPPSNPDGDPLYGTVTGSVTQ